MKELHNGELVPVHNIVPGRTEPDTPDGVSDSPYAFRTKDYFCTSCGMVKKKRSDFGTICSGTKVLPDRVHPRLLRR